MGACSGGPTISKSGGGRQPIIWPKFSRKLHENEKKKLDLEGWGPGMCTPWIRQWLVHLNKYQWRIQHFFVQDPIGWHASLTLGSSIDQQNADIIDCALSCQVIFIFNE